MSLILDHTIVPACDREVSAQFFSKIFGLSYTPSGGRFAAVRVNDTLTLDFDTRDTFESHHLAFKVDDATFDAIFSRIEAEGVVYGSGPEFLSDMKINHRRGGRGCYFRDPNRHILEILTA